MTDLQHMVIYALLIDFELLFTASKTKMPKILIYMHAAFQS